MPRNKESRSTQVTRMVRAHRVGKFFTAEEIARAVGINTAQANPLLTEMQCIVSIPAESIKGVRQPDWRVRATPDYQGVCRDCPAKPGCAIIGNA